MTGMTPKERLLKALKGERVDRAPVITSSALISAVDPGFLSVAGVSINDLTCDASSLAGLSLKFREATGFESLALPYTMTVESEAYGAETEGEVITEYPVKKDDFKSKEFGGLPRLDVMEDGRLLLCAGALTIMKEKEPMFPVIADLPGPLTLASSVSDAGELLRAMIKSPEGVSTLLERLLEGTVSYAGLLKRHGADVFFIAEQFVDGGMLGTELFRKFSLRYVNELTSVINGLGAPSIVHFCGDVSALKHALTEVEAECLSVDSGCSLQNIKQFWPEGRALMGNISALELAANDEARARELARTSIREGFEIIATSCSVDASVPLKNLRAVTDTVRSS